VLDKVKEKYGNAQVVTTYAASNFYTDANGQMTRGEGVQALMALVDGIAGRKGWPDLHGHERRRRHRLGPHVGQLPHADLDDDA